MGKDSGIAWTHDTFNGWTVCTEVSPGCDNCYARSLVNRFYGSGWGAGIPRKLFKTPWKSALTWNKEADVSGIRRRVFAMSLADWADREVPKEWRDRFWALVKKCTSLDWLLLTKRHIDASVLPEDWGNGYNNVWMGVSVESKKYQYRVDNLMKIPARIHWISAEPLLEDLDWDSLCKLGIDWFVIGGESDQKFKARQFDARWAMNAIDECHRNGKKVFIKQMGSNALTQSSLSLFDKHGANPEEWMKELRVREFPL